MAHWMIIKNKNIGSFYEVFRLFDPGQFLSNNEPQHQVFMIDI